MGPKSSLDWRTLALIGSLVLSLVAIGIGYVALQPPAPEPVETLGVEKFYRDAYFKGNLTVGGNLTTEDIAFSGPVTFGSDTVTASGEFIAHGLGITPTAVLLTPISATLTSNFVVAVTSTNAISFAVGITPTAVSNNIGIYWMAGK